MPKEEVTMFASLAYGIWTSRKKLCFEQKNYPPEVIILQAISANYSFQDAFLAVTLLNADPPTPSHPKVWCPPAKYNYKFNSDASKLSKEEWGLGVIIRDKEGNIIAATTRKLEMKLEPKMAEVMAFRSGLELAKYLCLWEIETKIDCLEVVNGLNYQSSNMSLFDLLIQDCVLLADSFR